LLDKNIKSGLRWSFISIIVIKLTGFLTQYVMGWYLDVEAYAKIAVLMSILTVMQAFSESSGVKLIMKHGVDDEKFKNNIYTLSFLLAIFITIGFIIYFYITKNDSFYLLIIPIILFVSISANLRKAVYLAEKKFRFNSKINSWGAIVKSLSTILLIVAGLGYLGVIVANILGKISEFILSFSKKTSFNFHVPALIKRENLPVMKQYFWVMIGSFGISFSLKADSFGLMFANRHDYLGVYFFAVQLQLAISSFITGSISSVLIPSFSSMTRDDVGEQLIVIVQKLFFYMFPLLMIIVLFLPNLIDFIWQGKWNESIFIAQTFFIGLVFKMLSPIFRAVNESAGRWRFQSLLLWLDSLVVFILAYFFSANFNLKAVASSILIYKILYGIFIMFITCHKERKKILPFGKIIVKSVIMISVSLILTQYVRNVFLQVLLFSMTFFLLILTIPVFKKEYVSLYLFLKDAYSKLILNKRK